MSTKVAYPGIRAMAHRKSPNPQAAIAALNPLTLTNDVVAQLKSDVHGAALGINQVTALAKATAAQVAAESTVSEGIVKTLESVSKELDRLHHRVAALALRADAIEKNMTISPATVKVARKAAKHLKTYVPPTDQSEPTGTGLDIHVAPTADDTY